MSGEGSKSVEALVDELERYCRGDELSLNGLRERLALIPPKALRTSSFFHIVCASEHVTLEVVAFILNALPEAANAAGAANIDMDEWIAYPIHWACDNVHCPNSVIKLLVDKSPNALGHPCEFSERGGARPYDGTYENDIYLFCDERISWEQLPISSYLTRPSNTNIDLDTVKTMVEAHPQALVACQDAIFPVAHALLSNPNIGNLAGNIVQFLSTANPSSLRLTNSCNGTPLHVACGNRNMDSTTVRLLLNAWPESASHRDIYNDLPIHSLSKNWGSCGRFRMRYDHPKRTSRLYAPHAGVLPADDGESLEILNLLIEAHPLGVREHGGNGCLAIHHAVRHRSQEFCNILVDAYPESLSIAVPRWSDPSYEGPDELDPAVLNRNEERDDLVCHRIGHLPIHRASDPLGLGLSDLQQMAGRIKFLLAKDPDSASKGTIWPGNRTGNWPLHVFCSCATDQALDALKLLFDAYPEAICATTERGRTPLDCIEFFKRSEHDVEVYSESENSRKKFHRFTSHEVNTFLETQIAYARTAQDSRAMTTLDQNGWLPLHHALHENAPLGSIKLLAEGNPFALRVADFQRSFPLHIACEFATVGIVQYLVDLDGSPLHAADGSNNSLLHRACRGGNCQTANYLLGINARGTLERNASNKLPIHLLWECEEEKVDRDSPEYVETIWRLMLANPEDVMCGFA